MSDINTTTLQGRLVKDPELRYSESGYAVCRFSIANNQYKKNAENNKKVNYIDCVAFGKTAEMVGSSFTKGNSILLSGTVNQDSWTTPEGAKRSKININVNAVYFQQGLPFQNDNNSNNSNTVSNDDYYADEKEEITRDSIDNEDPPF